MSYFLLSVCLLFTGTEILQTTERSSITLTCPHDDGGSHVPTWSREIGGKQQPIRLHVSTGTRTLMFPNLQPADSGLYLCDGKPAVYLHVIKGESSERGERQELKDMKAGKTQRSYLKE